MSVAMILGPGARAIDEVYESEEVLGRDWWDVAIATGWTGINWPRRVHAWASTLRANRLGKWRDLRTALGHPGDVVTYSHVGTAGRFSDVQIPHPWGGHGGSELFAVRVALTELGSDCVVLVGAPCGAGIHAPDPKTKIKPTDAAGLDVSTPQHERAWRVAATEMGDRVRSLSVARTLEDDGRTFVEVPGFTTQLLGGPTTAWLGVDPETPPTDPKRTPRSPALENRPVQDGEGRVTGRAILADPHGLHGRPAVNLVRTAGLFDASVVVRVAGREADARSITSAIGLTVSHGDILEFTADGPDARAAIAAMLFIVENAPSVRREGLAPPCPPRLADESAHGRVLSRPGSPRRSQAILAGRRFRPEYEPSGPAGGCCWGWSGVSQVGRKKGPRLD